jgi:hypothetical protein
MPVTSRAALQTSIFSIDIECSLLESLANEFGI